MFLVYSISFCYSLCLQFQIYISSEILLQIVDKTYLLIVEMPFLLFFSHENKLGLNKLWMIENSPFQAMNKENFTNM